MGEHNDSSEKLANTSHFAEVYRLCMPQSRDESDDVLGLLKASVVLAREDWASVPGKVKKTFRAAGPVAKAIKAIASQLPAAKGYGDVYWHADNRALHAVIGPSDDATKNMWHTTLRALPNVQSMTIVDDELPKNKSQWVCIKRAESLLAKPFELAGWATGGSSPLTNAIVGGLLGAAGGYGAGWLAEQVLPRRYVERGRLRRTLAAIGGGLGAVPGVAQGVTNYGLRKPDGSRLGWSAFITPNVAAPVDASLEAERANAVFGKEAAAFVKIADAFGASGGAALRAVPMDAFNQAIWNDVQKWNAAENLYGTKNRWGDNSQGLHTPPAVAAAASGVLAGIGEMYPGRSVLSPSHFMRGLAAAGVDLATARVVGGTLGALGGLSPEAQDKLQDIGVWSGVLRGAVGSLLGQ